jgi:hypothetical protein
MDRVIIRQPTEKDSPRIVLSALIPGKMFYAFEYQKHLYVLGSTDDAEIIHTLFPQETKVQMVKDETLSVLLLLSFAKSRKMTEHRKTELRKLIEENFERNNDG